MTVLTTPDEYALLRDFFASQEQLSPADANRLYSDSKLQAAASADRTTYEKWLAEALEAQRAH